MSDQSLAELARAEAAAAEQENPDGDEAAEAAEAEQGDEAAQKPGDEPEAAESGADAAVEPLTEAQIEARVKSWERERDRHFRELQKRDEDRYAVSEVCPVCEGHGLFLVELPEPIATQRRQAVSVALGGTGEPDYRDDEMAETCERCAGLGMLVTGSRVPGQVTHVCPDCVGQGWKPKMAQPPIALAPPPLPAQPQPFAGAAAVGSGPDAWGRQPGQERYGQHPSVGGW